MTAINLGNHTHSIPNHNHGGIVPHSGGLYIGGLTNGITVRDGTTAEKISSIWDVVKTKTNLKENEYMETLYQVTVVGKTKEIILDKESVVAADQENAKFLVGLYGILADRSLTPADVTVIVTAIGQVKVERESK